MNRYWFVIAIGVCLVFGNSISAQDPCVTYKLVPQTTYKTRPVTLSSTVNQTVMQSQQVVTYKPVWTTETRYRKNTTYKPIVTTSEREERYLVRRPIIETSYRERKIQETSYQTVTEMTEKRYLVETPTIETQMQQQQFIVRKPVTTTVMQSENVTTYKPTTVSETQLVAGADIQNQLVLQPGRNRLRRLTPGIYVDPVTGQSVYRRRGLHWAQDQNLMLQQIVQPTLVPQQVSRTTYSPETVTVQKPVQVTQYIDQIEQRQVPVQVATTSKKIHVLKIPVTVHKPVTKIRTEKIPVNEVKYREEVYTRKVPVTETKYQKVETSQPYQIRVCNWVAETQDIQVPTTVAKRINYAVDQVYPETKWIRVPIDVFGNALTDGEVVATQQHAPIRYQMAQRIADAPIASTLKPPTATASTQQPKIIVGKPVVVRKLDDDEFRLPTPTERPQSVLIADSSENIKATTETVLVEKRPTLDVDSNENTASSNDSNKSIGTDQSSAPSTSDPQLDIPPAPQTPDEDAPATGSLEVSPSDSGEIDDRPQGTESDDELTLDG